MRNSFLNGEKSFGLYRKYLVFRSLLQLLVPAFFDRNYSDVCGLMEVA